MKITPIRTHKITNKDKDILKILDKYITRLSERSIVAITSKIISITEGRMVKIGKVDKDELIKQESQYYLPRKNNKYNVSLTITKDTLVATAGIDQSNGNGYYILWPKNPQQTANKIRSYLQKRFKIKNVGVVITDSKTTPLRWGVTAFALSYSGFLPLKDYIGKPDIFGRKFEFEKMSIIDNLSCSAALVMGEGREQTPIAIIENVPFVEFRQKDPSIRELGELKIPVDDDLYAPFLKSVKWKKGLLS